MHGWRYAGPSSDGRREWWQSPSGYYWTFSRGRAIDLPPKPGPWEWLLARHDADRNLRALVEPYPRPLDDVVDVAPDDDLVLRRDDGRFGRREYGSVRGDLSRMHLHFAARPGSEEAALDHYITPSAWERITEVIRSLRVPEDDGLGVAGPEGHEDLPES